MNHLFEHGKISSKRLEKKEKLGQYFSSPAISNLMASMMTYNLKHIKILDPGAGTGSLFSACVNQIFNNKLPDSIQIVAYEIDHALFDQINHSIKNIKNICKKHNVEFSFKIINRNFIKDYDSLSKDFTHIIMNPPYQKITKLSETYSILKNIGVESTNMYSAFIDMSKNLLYKNGHMTFISPRSFCNGRYFESFRKNFLKSLSIKQIHLFNSRNLSFKDVLQENVIIYAQKNYANKDIIISFSDSPTDDIKHRCIKKSQIIFDDDVQSFIHIPSELETSKIMRNLPCTLNDLNITVSTGKIIDFRIKDELRFCDESDAVPLVRPFNMSNGIMQFPNINKKHCNYIISNEKSRNLLLNNGNYVLVKRFTTPEERKRVIASLWSRNECDSELVGFENRINYFHNNGNGLPYNLARGLCIFLNSDMVDKYFRQFSGNTQVNATDLRYIKYPTTHQLEMLGHSKITIKQIVDELLSKH